MPRAKRVVYLRNPSNPAAQQLLEEVQKAARALGLRVDILNARNIPEIDAVGTSWVLSVANGLMSYGPSLKQAMRRVAVYVDKILHGARPSDLPIEQVSKVELVIDLRVARAQGLEIPQDLLLRADEVIR